MLKPEFIFLKKLLPVLCILAFAGTSYGQSFFRIEADVSMKTKPSEGKGQLILGRVYYDRTNKKMVYDIRFPEKEVWVMKDSMAYTFREHQLFRTDKVNPFIESTIFHICLEGKLSDYGLRDTFYKADKVEKDGDLVITTWVPPKNFPIKGSVLTSNKKNQLYGVVVLDDQGKVLSRQIFKEYKTVSGLKIPVSMVQVIYYEGQEIYQTITLSNILVNNLKNENYYNHPVN